MSKKIGVSKSSLHKSIHAETVAHEHVPGRAYDISDPAIRLMNVVGGGFFNEPKYYGDNTPDADGVTGQAKEIIDTAREIARGDNPEDLLVLAAWARDPIDGLKIRYTSQILFAVAAAEVKTRPFLTKYATDIMKRADEIRQVFAAFRQLFCKRADGRATQALPHALQKSLAAAFAKQNDYNLVKYNVDARPTFGDVLLMLRGHVNIPKGMFRYLTSGTVDEQSPDIIKNRKLIFDLPKTAINKLTTEMLRDAGMTWENTVSHFGSTKEVWELVIPLMGEMAITRNLRNFEQAGISEKSWEIIRASMVDSQGRTKQLPFRFYTADLNVGSSEAKSLNGLMLDQACQNIPDLPGITAIFVDNSGSCGTKISGNSQMSVYDAGNMLAAVLAKRVGNRVKVGAFGDVFVWIPLSEANSCMSHKETITNYAHRRNNTKNSLGVPYYVNRTGSGVGGGTETGLWFGINDLIQRKIHVDRIILLSDLCCYTQGDVNCGVNLREYFGKDGDKATIESMIRKYRRTVNPDMWVHSVNLSGFKQSQVKPDGERNNIMSGWSEQIFSLIADTENVSEQSQMSVALPSLEALRTKYSK